VTPTTTKVIHYEQVDDTLARAVFYRTLKLAFQLPEQSTLDAIFSTDGKEALEQAAARFEVDGTGPLSDVVERFCVLPKPWAEELRPTFERLFGHTLRGRVCPYECEYGRNPLLQQAHQLADLGGFYAAFGLRPASENGERVDHVACELEFLEFLTVKEVVALELEERDGWQVTHEAARQFLRQHLARFGRAFARNLRAEAPPGFYLILAELCEVFLGVECDRLGVPLGPELLALRPEEDEPVPMACGSDGVVQIGDRSFLGVPELE
jgi:TorA maturation chaperone TorD